MLNVHVEHCSNRQNHQTKKNENLKKKVETKRNTLTKTQNEDFYSVWSE